MSALGGKKEKEMFVGWGSHKPRPLGKPHGGSDVGVAVSLEADEESAPGRKKSWCRGPEVGVSSTLQDQRGAMRSCCTEHG